MFRWNAHWTEINNFSELLHDDEKLKASKDLVVLYKSLKPVKEFGLKTNIKVDNFAKLFQVKFQILYKES